jgi:hypothetical protein
VVLVVAGQTMAVLVRAVPATPGKALTGLTVRLVQKVAVVVVVAKLGRHPQHLRVLAVTVLHRLSLVLQLLAQAGGRVAIRQLVLPRRLAGPGVVVQVRCVAGRTQ